MIYNKIRQSGQAALEYMLLLTVVAVVIFIALKPSGSPSTLNRAQVSTEQYYNTVSAAIMGKNPQPIHGGWCPAKPSGERECACPQPAFGGNPCVAASAIIYCGDGVCNGSETGEPGHPTGASDPLMTCFEDCNFLPNCGLCGTMNPGAICGEPCPTIACQGVEVCMTSNCPPGCPGFTQVCQQNALLCSGACQCTGTWTELAGCGVAVGACVPLWTEKCFQNDNCNSSCTVAQSIQARPDPVCGSCVATPVTIQCGPGTATLPPTGNGLLGSVACPVGCAPGTMSQRCVDGVFSGPIANICVSVDCPATPASNPDCGSANLPSTPHGTVGQIGCPNLCGGTLSGTCNLGTYINITDMCIPRPCPDTSMPTINCGNVTLPAVGNGIISNAASCPAGCTGAFSARCSNASFVAVNDTCFLDCPVWTTPTSQCDPATIPSTNHGLVSTDFTCGVGCTGSASATCGNGTFFGFSDGCIGDNCPATVRNTGACGDVNLPATAHGSSTPAIICPAGCTGTVSAPCSRGAFGATVGSCGPDSCPAIVRNTGACGDVTLPLTTHGNSTPAIACPAGCSGTVSASCSFGAFGATVGSCTPNSCPATPLNTGACGNVILPATASGNSTPPVACPAGCSGSMSATCSFGVFGPPSGSCTPDSCPNTLRNTGACGDVNLPATAHGSSTPALACPGGCTGTVSASCSFGAFGATVGSCTLPIYTTNFSVAVVQTNLPNDQSFSACYATNISTISVTPAGICGNPGTPGSACTITAQ